MVVVVVVGVGWGRTEGEEGVKCCVCTFDFVTVCLDLTELVQYWFGLISMCGVCVCGVWCCVCVCV